MGPSSQWVGEPDRQSRPRSQSITVGLPPLRPLGIRIVPGARVSECSIVSICRQIGGDLTLALVESIVGDEPCFFPGQTTIVGSFGLLIGQCTVVDIQSRSRLRCRPTPFASWCSSGG